MTKEELQFKIKSAERELETMKQLKAELGDNRYADKLLEYSKRHLYYLRRRLEKTE